MLNWQQRQTITVLPVVMVVPEEVSKVTKIIRIHPMGTVYVRSKLHEMWPHHAPQCWSGEAFGLTGAVEERSRSYQKHPVGIMNVDFRAIWPVL